tara:strand:+ start:216 stop:488 length:273 start_codon:yes stop_codon:yes gene_type:complete
MINDPNFKPNLVCHGEVCFEPQLKKIKQEKNKKEKLKPMRKKEDIQEMTDEDLKLTLALAEKYQYVTESDEEEGEDGKEGDEGEGDNSAW